MKIFLLVPMTLIFLVACEPKVGSDQWCADLREKRTDDWTLKETEDYAKNCIIRFGGKNDS